MGRRDSRPKGDVPLTRHTIPQSASLTAPVRQGGLITLNDNLSGKLDFVFVNINQLRLSDIARNC